MYECGMYYLSLNIQLKLQGVPTQWFEKFMAMTAGPKVLAGFMLDPVSGIWKFDFGSIASNL